MRKRPPIIYIGWKAIPLLLFFILSQMIGCGGEENDTSRNSSFPPQLELMNAAPEFSLVDLSGNRKNSEDYKGKITIVNFWATWCGYCRKEIPGFNHLKEKYQNQGVQIIGVSLDSSTRIVRAFLEDVPIDYDVLMGDRKISNDFGGIVGLPTTFIIDREWRVRKVFPGYVGQHVIEKEVKALLPSKG